MRYAHDTTVPVERSRAEIERLITRYGADKYGTGWTGKAAWIAFETQGRMVRFILPLPQADQFRATRSYEQACRQRWRALVLLLKAKLEAVESGISVFEREFLAHIVLPGGETVGEVIAPQIAAAYASGRMPQALLPDYSAEASA